MFIDESLWIRDVLGRTLIRPGMTVLDIGSSTLEFRTVVQPHIDRNVFAPLRERGARPIHLDARDAPGVDIIADVTTLDGVSDQFDLVLCTNLLEHVTDRSETVRHIKRVVSPGGLLLLTVPNRYPLHDDPIDTGFRPNARQLVELIDWPNVLEQTVIDVRSPNYYRGLKRLRRFVLPWRIACVLAKKPWSSRAPP